MHGALILCGLETLEQAPFLPGLYVMLTDSVHVVHLRAASTCIKFTLIHEIGFAPLALPHHFKLEVDMNRFLITLHWRECRAALVL